ncbi:MAG: hypothetical protein RIQ89_796 [Bacteroidota bacterium]
MNSFSRISFLLFLLVTIAFYASSQRVGLVLSGGGARGIAHIGVIKALEENNIPIDYITGTSAGAIVAAMYAQGYSPNQMDSIVRTDEFYNWANGIIPDDYTYYYRKKENNASWITLKFSLDSAFQTAIPTNLVSTVPIDFALMEHNAGVNAICKNNFDSLFIPFRCVAADVEAKKSMVFRNGDLGQAVRASAAFPFYFKPLIYNGKLLYDGGLYNNFPIDVMMADFQPDLIIGVNAGGSNLKLSEENIISQIRTMMTTPTDFDVRCENSILISPNTDEFGLFDFDKPEAIIESGYKATLPFLQQLKIHTTRRIANETLQLKRQKFRSNIPPILVENVLIEGVNSKQATYIKRILKPGNTPLPLERIKASYFQLVADENIRSIYPQLIYDTLTKKFNLHIKVQRENNLIAQFGGNISSRPISEAFAGFAYNVWGKNSYSFNGNVYVGKLYNSGRVSIRRDSPARLQHFLEVESTINYWDFYRSNYLFFTDVRPSYIIKSDMMNAINAGIPLRSKGKLIGSMAYSRISNRYYQDAQFNQSDTADESLFKGFTGALHWERSTLNKKQYANSGTLLSVKFRFTSGQEAAIPGSTSINRNTVANGREWITTKLTYENYYKKRGILRLGLFSEICYSNQPFFANYTASSLMAPAFEPIAETKTLFLPNYRTHAYVGAGVKNIFLIRSNLELRLEGYALQPHRELIKTNDLKTTYGRAFNKRYFIGAAGLVFQTPIGPASFFLNYYNDRENQLSLLFHFGYVIFNRGSLD